MSPIAIVVAPAGTSTILPASTRGRVCLSSFDDENKEPPLSVLRVCLNEYADTGFSAVSNATPTGAAARYRSANPTLPNSTPSAVAPGIGASVNSPELPLRLRIAAMILLSWTSSEITPLWLVVHLVAGGLQYG